MPFDVERHLARYPYHAVVRNVAAVTCHFNPHRSRARRRCYQTFARQFPAIGLELFVAEGSGDDRWEVPEDGRVHRFRIAAPTCLFAKENLLNLAIERLPDRFESVLWIDADVLMLPHDFADLLSEALDRHAVVQGFRRLVYLNGDGTPQMNWRHSVAARNLADGSRSADPRQAFPGLAWAARRELLARIGGLYDRVIMGGGDVAWAAAVYGDTRTPYLRRWSAPLLRDALRYVQQVAPLVPSVGCVEADGVHLFHGTIRARRYAWRDSVLRQFDYDPRTHLEYAPNGTLRWTRAGAAGNGASDLGVHACPAGGRRGGRGRGRAARRAAGDARFGPCACGAGHEAPSRG